MFIKYSLFYEIFFYFLFFIFSINHTFSQWVFDIVPEPKINEDGKCVVYYELSEKFKYIPGTEIVDWKNSGRKINTNEPIKQHSKYLIETYHKKNGLKKGKYTLSLSIPTTLSSGALTLSHDLYAEVGKYLNDKLNGVKSIYLINYKNYIESYKFDNCYLYLNYQEDIIIDTLIKFPIYPCEIATKDKFFRTINLEPFIQLKKGKVIRSLFIDNNNNPCYYLGEKNHLNQYLRYTRYPIYYNEFSYFTNDFSYSQKEKEFPSLEFFSIKQGLDYKSKLYEGLYNLYVPQNEINIFDTTFLSATTNFNAGFRNGLCKEWGLDKNGYIDTPWYIFNYNNDLLDGESKEFFKDGKPRVIANFSKGYLEGIAKLYTYGNPSEKLSRSVSKWKNKKGGITHISQIYEKSYNNLEESNLSENYVNDLALIRQKGGVIDDYNGYSLLMTINYKVDSIYNQNKEIWDKGSVALEDYFVYQNNKIIVKYELDKTKPWKTANVIWYNKNGNELYSMAKLNKENQNKLQIMILENQKQNNKIVKCDWCAKNHKYGESKMIDHCNCIDRKNGNLISPQLFKWAMFCSNECRSKYDKDCCIRNGYTYEK